MWQIASNKTMVLAFLGRKLRDFKQAKPHSTTTHTPNKLTPPFKKARKFLKTWKSVTSSHARVAQNLSDGPHGVLSVSYLAATMHLQLHHFPILWSRNVSSTSLMPRVPFLPLPPTDEALKSTLLSFFFSTHNKHTPSLSLSQALSRKVTKQLPKSLSSNSSKARDLRRSKKSLSFLSQSHTLFFSAFWFFGWVPESANPANPNLRLWLLNLKQAAKQSTPSLSPSKTPLKPFFHHNIAFFL